MKKKKRSNICERLRSQDGFLAIEYMVIFALIFPFVMLLPDFVQWGGNYVNAQVIVNDTAQKMGEHGGQLEGTVKYMEQRFASSGLDPAKWDLTLTSGPLFKGEEGIIEVSSSYRFKSLNIIGVKAEFPLKASATYTSQVWSR
ncbi:hypothetical protein ABHN05_13150 [Brevibacillus laterosporus]|nr:hypothetical protein [Brevibacillus laterosporus]MBG9790979.1 hypothetical protein [Brevibacillus laterosporus]MBG9804898.1 hypothetical protein [Brevibacillus laterosporus]MED1790546.1 hypothetical protein [Brevibacillus laterosporus]MED4762093.1 hypothetical protein [Brevibacillus laterosporus]TPH09955.1 hypothetical protein EGH09_21605 [Brevibacillus laterosporus]